MVKGNILFICGSNNQTTMMHEISKHVEDYDKYFTPYYSDGLLDTLARKGLLEFTILGEKIKRQTLSYLESHSLQIDYKGKSHDYDLVFTCSDLIVPKNIRGKKIVLVQEGMTDPENLAYYLVKILKLPRYLASTSMQGLSNQYDVFCVASEGYKEFFIKKGIKEEKIVVTGIPNFDDVKRFLKNDFPLKNYVLAATSDARETYRFENRKKFIREALKIANGRKLIFKLHPNEIFTRAINEIQKYAPEALIITEGNINALVANCDVLITKYSSVVYIGLALGKEVYSDFDIEELKTLTPIQNNASSAKKIANVGIELLGPPRNYPIEEFEIAFQES